MSKSDELRALREAKYGAAALRRRKSGSSDTGSLCASDREPVRPAAQRDLSGSQVGSGGDIEGNRKRGRPRLEEAASTVKAKEPWQAEGMSRATWYRRKAEKKEG